MTRIPLSFSRRMRFRRSVFFCALSNMGMTCFATKSAMTRIIGMAMNMTVERRLFSVNAITAPPTMTIGALIIMRIIISTMSCIWRISFVVRVISEGMALLGERTITIDCDVLQGDGGTRTASVTGGFAALALACRRLVEDGDIGRMPIRHYVAGVSAGIVAETPMLDLQYSEDSRAQVDLNCIMNELGEIIEIQGTGEGRAFSLQEQQALVELCARGNRELIRKQKELLGDILR